MDSESLRREYAMVERDMRNDLYGIGIDDLTTDPEFAKLRDGYQKQLYELRRRIEEAELRERAPMKPPEAPRWVWPDKEILNDVRQDEIKRMIAELGERQLKALAADRDVERLKKLTDVTMQLSPAPFIGVPGEQVTYRPGTYAGIGRSTSPAFKPTKPEPPKPQVVESKKKRAFAFDE